MEGAGQMNYFESERLLLKELEEEHIDDRYLSWFRDEKVTKFLEAKNLTKQSVIDHFRYGKETNTYYMYAIISKDSSKHIGNLKVGPIEWKHRISDLVTVIGDRDYWGKGLATEAIKMGNRIAFDIHDLRKLSAGIYSDNVASIKCYLKAGWIVEAVFQGDFILNGKILDRVCVSCFNPKHFDFMNIKQLEFEWVKK
jgi:RimJ/RimL family protein N-acetyltransferase